MTKLLRILAVLALATAIASTTSACSVLSSQIGLRNDAKNFVGRWVVRFDSNSRDTMCRYDLPWIVEFFDDGTYTVPSDSFIIGVWRGKTWEILEDGRLRIDLGSGYGVYEYTFGGSSLFIRDPGLLCASRYVRADQ